jgi:hypothetical protein
VSVFVGGVFVIFQSGKEGDEKCTNDVKFITEESSGLPLSSVKKFGFNKNPTCLVYSLSHKHFSILTSAAVSRRS